MRPGLPVLCSRLAPGERPILPGAEEHPCSQCGARCVVNLSSLAAAAKAGGLQVWCGVCFLRGHGVHELVEAEGQREEVEQAITRVFPGRRRFRFASDAAYEAFRHDVQVTLGLAAPRGGTRS